MPFSLSLLLSVLLHACLYTCTDCSMHCYGLSKQPFQFFLTGSWWLLGHGTLILVLYPCCTHGHLFPIYIYIIHFCASSSAILSRYTVVLTPSLSHPPPFLPSHYASMGLCLCLWACLLHMPKYLCCIYHLLLTLHSFLSASLSSSVLACPSPPSPLPILPVHSATVWILSPSTSSHLPLCCNAPCRPEPYLTRQFFTVVRSPANWVPAGFSYTPPACSLCS